jgi:hypothetical protein
MEQSRSNILRNNLSSEQKKSLLINQQAFFLITRQRPTLPRQMTVVPSALRVLTTVFGMGTGVALSQLSPGILKT